MSTPADPLRLPAEAEVRVEGRVPHPVVVCHFPIDYEAQRFADYVNTHPLAAIAAPTDPLRGIRPLLKGVAETMLRAGEELCLYSEVRALATEPATVDPLREALKGLKRYRLDSLRGWIVEDEFGYYFDCDEVFAALDAQRKGLSREG